ncbi:thiamine pyrophosphate-binding protein [Haloechinothrix sp. YIM 98757]|uniref:Thiamine pyrophosphate-binding protein n=1 Tax=Haloechinothrix aidingensis TaxID=2752311 RepID=A0A838AAC6_9PSEU|nr:thiamine pyrophosphate-binding protein [Haloechinothrix aidingensis]MBA0126181.1 thiamine pyrophosphate-binding protein [Haloechinothrix aidingensis]
MTAATTNADQVLGILEEAGVEQVFTCPGTTEVPLLDASVARQGVRFVLATHEAAAVAMADGYARASGRPGVALLHANVGMTNGLAMVEAARVGRSPVLVLNGTKPTGLRNRRTFTATPGSAGVAAPFTVAAMEAGSAASLPADLAEALAATRGSRRGPVYLGLAQDLLAQAATGRAAGAQSDREVTGPAGDEAIDAVARHLVAAERVAIVAGSDLARAGVTREIEQLAELLPAPVFEPPWRDVERETVDTAGERYCGLLSDGADLLDGAVVLVVGTPAFQEPDDGPCLLPDSARVVHVTEPGTAIQPGASVLPGDVGRTVELLATRVREHARAAGGEDGRDAERAYWTDSVRREHRRRLEKALGGPGRDAGGGAADPAGERDLISTVTLCRVLDEWRNRADPVVADAVTATATLLRALPRGAGPFYATGSGSLGWGLGAAVGVALARPDERVHALVADGVFQFGIQAVRTAVAEGAPVTWIVLNNRSYHAVRLALRGYGGAAARTGTYPCSDLGDTDVAALARAFGAYGRRVSELSQLPAALDEAGSRPGPSVVEVMVAADTANPAR